MIDFGFWAGFLVGFCFGAATILALSVVIVRRIAREVRRTRRELEEAMKFVPSSLRGTVGKGGK